MRFPLEVLSSVRNALPDDFPVLVKLNLNDGFAGGLQIDESIEVARALDEHGAKAIILSGSYTSRTPFYLMRGKVPLKGMVEVEKNRLQKLAIALFGPFIMRRHEFEENYFLALAMKMRQSVSVPLVYQGGVVSSRGIAAIMRNGFDAVGVGRALIHDPEFAAKVRHNENHVSPCNHCNLCMVEMDRGGVRCVI